MTKPLTFHGFIGQGKAVNVIRKHAAGCKANGKSFPHTLLSGCSGFGKTELAQALAKEMNVNIHKVIADTSLNMQELIASIRSYEIVFIDEAHALKKDDQESLFPIVDTQPASNKVVGAASHVGSEQRPEITVIFATDQPGRLVNALNKRIPLKLALVPYSEEEMVEIIAKMATMNEILLTAQARRALAQCSQGNPRIARHHIRLLITHCEALNGGRIETPDVTKYLDDHGYDEHHRDVSQLQYLKSLSAMGGTASVDTLASQLGIDGLYLERQTEPFLLRNGWVSKSSRGRTITALGSASLLTSHSNPGA